MSQSLIQDFVLNCKQKLLTLNDTPMSTQFSSNSPIKVIGMKGVGKSFFVHYFRLFTSSQVNGKEMSIEEVSSNNPRLESTKHLIVIVNSYGLIEHQYIETLNRNKPASCNMIVILNYYTIKTFEAILLTQKTISANKIQHSIDKHHFYWTEEPLTFYLLINQDSTSFYSNKTVFHHLIYSFSNYCELPPNVIQFFKEKRDDRPDKPYYYTDYNKNQFVIEMEGYDKLKNANFTTTFREGNVEFHSGNYNPIQPDATLKLKVPYSIACLDFSGFQQEVEGNTLILKYPIIDTRALDLP